LELKSKGAFLRLSNDDQDSDAGVKIFEHISSEILDRINRERISRKHIYRELWSVPVISIELEVDGKIVDLNRIRLPADTPIIDERFKENGEQKRRAPQNAAEQDGAGPPAATTTTTPEGRSSSALDVSDANYVAEPYATYSQPGLEVARHMAFDGSGNLYVTHTYSSNMWRIRPNGEPSEFLTGFQPTGVEWGGGTLLGDYLYVLNGSPCDGALYRVDSNGQKTTVASWQSPRHGATVLRLDRVGNYGGHLFVATGSQDRICKLSLNGQISDFSPFPGWYDGGGPGDVAFDRGRLYEGLMYVSVVYAGENRHRGGVFTLDAGGNAKRFAKEIVAAQQLRFDPTGDFYGELFVTGTTDYDQEARLYRLGPDGTVKEFARANGLLGSIVFGPDGALYVDVYDKGDQTTFISRVVRKPADSDTPKSLSKGERAKTRAERRAKKREKESTRGQEHAGS